MESNSVCNHTSDKQNRTTAKRESDLLIKSIITDRIGRYEVLLPINQNYDNIWETNNHQLNVFMNENVTVDFFAGENEPNGLIYNSARKWRVLPNNTRHDA